MYLNNKQLQPNKTKRSPFFYLFYWMILLASLSGIVQGQPSNLHLKVPQQLTIISYRHFAPISYGDGQGYEADLSRAIAQLWQVGIKFYPESSYEGMWLLPSKSYTLADLAIGGFSPLSYRIEQGATFSQMTTKFKQSLLVRKKDFASGRIVSYQSFKKNGNFKIGIVPGTSGEIFTQKRLREHHLPLSMMVGFPSEVELLAALKTGTIDAIGRGEMGNEYQSLLTPEFVTIAKKDFGEGFTFAVDHSNPTLLQELNHALGLITDQGRLGYFEWLKDHRIFAKQVNKLKQKT